MYKEEIKELRSWVENGDPDSFLSIPAFVLCTIQTPLSRVKPQVEEVLRCGKDAKALWGFKKKGWEYILENKVSFYHMALRAPESPAEALSHFLATPGYHLPKAGFLSQLVGAEAACIDVHNMRRFGIDKNQLRRMKVDQYIDLCQDLGGSEYLWNSWCKIVADKKGLNKFETAEEVSRYHKECIIR